MHIKRTALTILAICMISLAGCLHPDAPQGDNFAAAPPQKKEFFIGQPAKENVKAIEEEETKTLTEEAKESGKATLDPEYSDILSGQAYNLLSSGNYEDAELMFDRALTYNPNNIVAQKGMKKIAELLKGDDTEAMQQSKIEAQKLIQLNAGMDEEAAYFLETGNEQADEAGNCEIEINDEEINKRFFNDVELFWPLPAQFRKNEVTQITGKLKPGAKERSITVAMGTKDDQMIYQAIVQDDIFSIPVFFDETGEMLLNIYLSGTTKTKAAKISVIDPECEPLIRDKTSLPNNLRYQIENGTAVFSWDDTTNNLFRIEFLQRQNRAVFYVMNEKRLTPPLSAFRSFEEGAAKVKIWAAIADKNSMDRKTMWMPGEEMELFLTQHISRNDQNISGVQSTEDFVIGDKVEIRGESEASLDPKFLILDRKGHIEISELTITDKKFYGSFLPERLGTHVVGIYEETGLPVFVGGIAPKGSVPLIPDYFDLERPSPRIDSDRIAENLFRYVNHERNAEKLTLLSSDDQLDSLAQSRADDMCKRNYLAEKNLDGLTADDEKKDYKITGEIVENIVETNDIRTAHEMLMRSPKSQTAILDPEMKKIGFGYCQRDPREKRFVIVEILENPVEAKQAETEATSEKAAKDVAGKTKSD